MDRDRLIYTPRSQPSQRLSAGAGYLLDASTAAFTCCGRPQRRLYRGVLEYLPFVL
ncbi:hypothetical protein [Agathobaculum sp.]|uniref:hypothetical protein n=1 Tax=Agathobaculum sp. TaxID=2048138 RepID=UPI003AB84009